MTDSPYLPREYTGFALAYTLIFFLFLVSVTAPVLLSAWGGGAPFLLMGVFYWSAYRPTLLPLWLVFTAGILLDFLSGAPVGLNTCILVAARWLVTDQRLFLTGQPFMIVWLGFIIVCAIAGSAQWLLYGALNLSWSPPEVILSMVGLGAFIFPPVCILLHATHQLLPAGSGGYWANR